MRSLFLYLGIVCAFSGTIHALSAETRPLTQHIDGDASSQWEYVLEERKVLTLLSCSRADAALDTIEKIYGEHPEWAKDIGSSLWHYAGNRKPEEVVEQRNNGEFKTSLVEDHNWGVMAYESLEETLSHLSPSVVRYPESLALLVPDLIGDDEHRYLAYYAIMWHSLVTNNVRARMFFGGPMETADLGLKSHGRHVAITLYAWRLNDEWEKMISIGDDHCCPK